MNPLHPTRNCIDGNAPRRTVSYSRASETQLLDVLVEPHIQSVLQMSFADLNNTLRIIWGKLSEHAADPDYASVFERMLEILLERTMDRRIWDMQLIRMIYESRRAGSVLIGIASTFLVVHEAIESQR